MRRIIGPEGGEKKGPGGGERCIAMMIIIIRVNI